MTATVDARIPLAYHLLLNQVPTWRNSGLESPDDCLINTANCRRLRQDQIPQKGEIVIVRVERGFQTGHKQAILLCYYPT